MSPLYIIIRMKSPIAVLLLVGLISAMTITVEAAPNTTVVQDFCSQDLWRNEYFEGVIYRTLYQVAVEASAEPSHVGYVETPVSYSDMDVYGYGECNLAISSTDCYDCLGAAATQLATTCYEAVGGRIQMVDCAMRYENYNFYPA